MGHKRILLYGQGNGRDHANHLALMKSPNIEICSLIQNENALMEKQFNNVYRVKNIEEAIKFANSFQPDLVIISNRTDLSNGATELFKMNGYKVFGITKDVAKLETNKEYSKAFMKRNNIPTPDYYVAENEEEAIRFVSENWNKTKNGYVLKVEQFSKNSFERTAVPNNLNDAKNNIYRLFNSTPNAKLIIEEKIKGYEISLHILINNGKYSIMPMVQDYKRKYPNDEGPMTAGTASVAESKQYPKEILKRLKKDIIKPTIKGFKREQIDYNYILYIGIMITEDGKPYVLEYNTRTGNPEWIALLGLLNVPLIKMIDSYYDNIETIEEFWKKDKISIAMCGFSSGYPETERTIYNEPIINLEKISKDTDIIGEHIVERKGILYPSGGRVLELRRVGTDFEELKKQLINDLNIIDMNGLYFRSDIKPIRLN